MLRCEFCCAGAPWRLSTEPLRLSPAAATEADTGGGRCRPTTGAGVAAAAAAAAVAAEGAGVGVVPAAVAGVVAAAAAAVRGGTTRDHGPGLDPTVHVSVLHPYVVTCSGHWSVVVL